VVSSAEEALSPGDDSSDEDAERKSQATSKLGEAKTGSRTGSRTASRTGSGAASPDPSAVTISLKGSQLVFDNQAYLAENVSQSAYGSEQISFAGDVRVYLLSRVFWIFVFVILIAERN